VSWLGKRYRSADEGREAGVDDPSVAGDEGPHPPERGDGGGPAPLGAAGPIPGLVAVLEAPPAAPGQHVAQALDELPHDDAAPAEATELAADRRGGADPRRPLPWGPERRPPRSQGQRQRGRPRGRREEQHRSRRRHFAVSKPLTGARETRSGLRLATARLQIARRGQGRRRRLRPRRSWAGWVAVRGTGTASARRLSPPPLRPAALPRCVFFLPRCLFPFSVWNRKRNRNRKCVPFCFPRACLRCESAGNFLDFGNCMAMIDLRGFWIGFGLRGEGTDFSVVVICEPQLLLVCCRLAVADNRGHGP